MADFNIPRCGGDMLVDLANGITVASPAQIALLNAAMNSAGLGGGSPTFGGMTASGVSIGATPVTVGSFTVPAGAGGILIFSGVYRVTGPFTAGTNAAIASRLRKNGSQFRYSVAFRAEFPGSTGDLYPEITGIINVAPGDVIDLQAENIGAGGPFTVSTLAGQYHLAYVIV